MLRSWSKDGRWYLQDRNAMEETKVVTTKDAYDRLIIGSRLEWHIVHQGMSHEQLARMTGLSASAISRICSGKNLPSVYVLMRVCPALGVSADELLGLDHMEENEEKRSREER